jgi:hypothetical protein
VGPLQLKALKWIKSSRSYGAGACVEVAAAGDGVAVRDSKNSHAAPLIYTRDEWSAFLFAVKRGEFDHLAASTEIGADSLDLGRSPSCAVDRDGVG